MIVFETGLRRFRSEQVERGVVDAYDNFDGVAQMGSMPVVLKVTFSRVRFDSPDVLDEAARNNGFPSATAQEQWEGHVTLSETVAPPRSEQCSEVL